MQRESVIDPVSLGIVDNEKSMMSKMLISSFRENKAFSKFVNVEVLEKKEAELRINQNELTAIVEIPEGFSKSIQYVENFPITVTLNEAQPLKSTIFKNMMQSYGKYISSVQIGVNSLYSFMVELPVTDKEIDNINNSVSVDLVLTAMSRSTFFNYHSYESIPSTNSLEYFLVALIVMFYMYIGLSAGGSLLQEKASGCVHRILGTSVSAYKLIAAKFVAYSVIASIYVIVFTVPAALLAKVDLEGNFLLLIMFMIISIGFVIALSITLAVFFKEQSAFILFGNLFIFIAALLGGSLIPLQLMPASIQNAAKVTPNYWIIRGALYIVKNYNLILIYKVSLTFIASTIVLLLVASYRLRRR
jgi:ABC-2 type transport system permease protein